MNHGTLCRLFLAYSLSSSLPPLPALSLSLSYTPPHLVAPRRRRLGPPRILFIDQHSTVLRHNRASGSWLCSPSLPLSLLCVFCLLLFFSSLYYRSPLITADTGLPSYSSLLLLLVHNTAGLEPWLPSPVRSGQQSATPTRTRFMMAAGSLYHLLQVLQYLQKHHLLILSYRVLHDSKTSSRSNYSSTKNQRLARLEHR